MVRPASTFLRLSALAIGLGACAAPVEGPVVAVGSAHACALVSGRLVCWGAAEQSRLGGDLDALPPLVDLDAGGSTTCAVTADGAVYCFGHNHHGQLGDGTLDASGIPRRVAGLPPVSQVSVGYAHVCARTDGGDVCCWGWNGSGQSAPERESLDVLTPVCRALDSVKVRAGFTVTCSIDSQGSASCFGELTVSRLPARDVAVGVDHLCALSESALTCYGARPGGARDRLEAPLRLPFAGGRRAAGALDHLCVTDARGALHCMGKNASGQLGDRTFRLRDAPSPVRGLPGAVSSVGVGGSHSCAVAQGRVWCWGWNDRGQLGDDLGVHSVDPVVVDLASIE